MKYPLLPWKHGFMNNCFLFFFFQGQKQQIKEAILCDVAGLYSKPEDRFIYYRGKSWDSQSVSPTGEKDWLVLGLNGCLGIYTSCNADMWSRCVGGKFISIQ